MQENDVPERYMSSECHVPKNKLLDCFLSMEVIWLWFSFAVELYEKMPIVPSHECWSDNRHILISRLGADPIHSAFCCRI